MVTILPYLRGVAFEPEVIDAMSAALEGVCQALHLPETAIGARGVIAKRIIALAQRGERDPARLRAMVLGQIGGEGDKLL